MSKRAPVLLVIAGLIILSVAAALYVSPTLRYRATMAIYPSESVLSPVAAAAVTDRVPVITRLSIDPIIEPSAMAVQAQELQVMAMVTSLGVNYDFEYYRVMPIFGLTAGWVPKNKLQSFFASPLVVSVEYDTYVHVPAASSTTSYLSLNEVVVNLGFTELWELGRGEGVNVVVIDSGAPRSSVVQVQDAWGVGDYPIKDSYGHGGAVAYIIHNLAPDATIYSIRALNEFGTGRISDIVKGIEMALELVPPPLVINLSLGVTPSVLDSLGYACELAVDHYDAKVVAAAGNAGGPVLSPARSPKVVGVGALNAQGEPTTYSCYGNGLDAMAYGDVVVNWMDVMRGLSGTSFAAPIVTASLANYLSAQTEPERVDEFALISASSEDMFEPGWDERTGNGRVDAAVMAETEPSYKVPVFERVFPYLAGSLIVIIVIGLFLYWRHK